VTSPSKRVRAAEPSEPSCRGGQEGQDEAVVVEPSLRRWETGSRVYTAEVTRDLFGDLVLKCTNGGIGKRHYRERTVATGEQAIASALSNLARLRRAHAYTLVETRRL
jgi:hypothetical protein